MSEEIESHVLERYEIHKKLGRGAYGIVWKAIDKRNKRTVALKKVFEAFQNSVDAQRTYREVMYLQELNGHDNIVRLLSIIRAHNNRDLYLVFEYMETDLHTVIKHNILQGIHKQFIFYQLLKALKYIHTGDLIHRDLKPSNLLINSECLIKVADFGLARSVAQKDDGQDPVVSDYVATRWYRAPEILLGSQCYNKAVDMWSAGCILAELIAGKVLFTGKSTLNQVELIIELLGRPKDSQIDALGSHVARNILANITAQKTRSFTQLFSTEGKDALDLLRRLLTFSPHERMTVEEALEHPYVRTWHCLQDEISCPKIIKLPVDDNIKLSLKEYRDAIYKDITEKSKQTKKAPQDNLPKINDKIKSVAASKEKNPEPEPSTTLGDKRSVSGAVTQAKDEPQVRPRRTLEPSTQATEKVRQNKSFEWNQTGASPTSSVLNNKVSNSFGVLQVSPSPSASKIQLENSLKSHTSTAQLVRGPTASGLAPAGTAHPLRVGSKQNYKSLDVSLENQHPGASHLHEEGYAVGGKWLRSVSPGGHAIQPSNPGLKSNKRLPSRQEDSNQSQSKGNFKVSQSSVHNDSLSGVNNSSKLKRSGYLLGSGTSLGAHKKSASLVQPYKSPTNNSKKEDPVVLTKKSSANYFFKKPKTKTEMADMDRGGQKQLLSVVSHPQKTFGFNGIGNHKLGV